MAIVVPPRTLTEPGTAAGVPVIIAILGGKWQSTVIPRASPAVPEKKKERKYTEILVCLGERRVNFGRGLEDVSSYF